MAQQPDGQGGLLPEVEPPGIGIVDNVHQQTIKIGGVLRTTRTVIPPAQVDRRPKAPGPGDHLSRWLPGLDRSQGGLISPTSRRDAARRSNAGAAAISGAVSARSIWARGTACNRSEEVTFLPGISRLGGAWASGECNRDGSVGQDGEACQAFQGQQSDA